MERLAFAIKDTKVQSEENINVGLIRPLESPFNLFLNFSQLIDYNKRYIYFFVNTYGKRKVVLWGVYDKQQKLFIVDGGCKFKVKQLQSMTKKWQDEGYKYVSNTVYDRFSSIILNYVDVETWTYDDYVNNKRLLRYLKGDLSEKAMIKEYGDYFLRELLPETVDYTDEYELADFTIELEQAIKKYETEINRTDYSDTILSMISNTIRKSLIEITNIFAKQIQEENYDTDEYESLLDACPDIETCRLRNTGACSVYTYGTDGNLHEEDIDAT